MGSIQPQTSSRIITAFALAAAAPFALAATETVEVDDFDAVAYTLPYQVEFVESDTNYVKLDESRLDELVRRYEAGESTPQLAAELGVHKDTVRR